MRGVHQSLNLVRGVGPAHLGELTWPTVRWHYDTMSFRVETHAEKVVHKTGHLVFAL